MSAEINGRIILPSPVGKLLLEERGGALVRLSFENQISGPLEQRSTPFLEQAAKQLAEYFRGERQEFSLALTYEGTEFQKKVWQALREIPYGQTRSYGQVAQMAGSPKASRANGKPQQPDCDYHSVPSGDWSQRQAGRLWRRIAGQGKAACTGSGISGI